MTDQAPQPPEAVSPEDAARMLSVSRTRIYQLMARGELRWARFGRHRRITRTSILDLLDRWTE